MKRKEDRFPSDDEHKEHENELYQRSDALRIRVINAKKKLPKGIIPLLTAKFPEYNNIQGRNDLTAVIQLRKTDVEITSKIEFLAEILKPEPKKVN